MLLWKYFRSDGILDVSTSLEILTKRPTQEELLAGAHPRGEFWVLAAPPYLQYFYLWLIVTLPQWQPHRHGTSSLTQHNIIQSNKKFVLRFEEDQPVTALGCSFEGHAEFVVATSNSKQTTLSVYSENSATAYTYYLAPDQTIIDIAFSGSAIIALSNNASLLLRRDPKTHLGCDQLLCIKLPYIFTRICEIYPGRVLLSGAQGICEVNIRQEPYPSEMLVLCSQPLGCVYYQNEICVVAFIDRICSFRTNNLVEQLLLSSIESEELVVKASCISRYSRGFFLGHGDKLAVSMFLFESGLIKYTTTFNLTEKVKGRILSMNLSSDEMYIAVTALVGDATTSVGEDIPNRSYIENMLVNLTNVTAERSLSSPFSRPFRNQVEYGTIQDIKGASVPRCLSLIGCNLVDYCYDDYFRRLVRFNLNQVLVSFAVHPLGFQLVCLFKDSLRVYCRLEKDLVEVFKLPYICSCAQYAENGMLAIAFINGSHHEIAILETVKFQTIRCINCFACKYPISQIHWNRENSHLHFTAGNGQFYIVDPLHNKKIAEFHQRKRQVSCLHFEELLGCLIVCFVDGIVRVHSYHPQESTFTTVQELQLNESITSMCFVRKIIVMGTASGKVMWISWPLPNHPEQGLFEQVNLSAEPIVHLFLAGLKYLVVGVSSGILYVFRLKRRKDNLLIDVEQELEYNRFKDIVMQSKSSLDQTKDRLKNLLEKRTSYIGELEEMKKEEESRYSLEVKELVQFTREKQRKNLKDIIQKVENNKVTRAELDKQRSLLRKKKQMAKQDWERYVDNQLLGVYRQHEKLTKELNQVKERLNGQYDQLKAELLRNVKHIEEEFSQKLTTGRSIIEQMRGKLTKDRRARELLGEEAREQIKIIKLRQRQEMEQHQRELNRANVEAKARVSKLQRQIDRYNLRKDFLEGKRKYLDNQFHVEQTQMKMLQRLKNSLNLELVNLEEATNKREEMIREFSNRNDKLIRFRQVYSYLQMHLEEETSTLKKHITVLSDQIMKVNGELVSVLNQDHQRNEMLHEGRVAKRKLEQLKKEQETPIARLQSLNNSVLSQLSQLAENNIDWTQTINKILGGLRQQMTGLQQLSNNPRLTSLKDNKFLESMEQYNLQQIRNNLTEQKKYLQQNIQLFWASQRLLEVDLVAVYVKLQAKNSNLITECNILKEKLNKKRKCLNEQMNNLKTGENLLLNIQRTHREVVRLGRPATSCNLSDWFSVISKEKRKNSEVPHLKVKTHDLAERENTVSTLTKCQTVLQICRMNPAQRSLRHNNRFPLDETINHQTQPPTSKPTTTHHSRTAIGRSRRVVANKRVVTGGASRPPILHITPLQ